MDVKDVLGIGKLSSSATSVVNNVINKISNTVGTLYDSSEYKIKLDSLKRVYDELSSNMNLTEFEKAVIIANFSQSLKQYINQRNIIANAILEISDEADASSVDDDWLNLFMDKAKNISSEEMQNI